jgi:hypothetical protein
MNMNKSAVQLGIVIASGLCAFNGLSVAAGLFGALFVGVYVVDSFTDS